MAMLLRYRFRLIVHVPATVGPFNIMEENHSAPLKQVPVRNRFQLKIDGVPVMIAVNQYAVEDYAQIG